MDFQPGDIVGFASPGFVGKIIRIATRGPLSHVGIVADFKKSLALFESTILAANGAKCIIQDRVVQGTQAHWANDILTRPGKIYRYRLTVPLTERERNRLTFFLCGQIGRPYDFIGAARSAPILTRALTWMFREESLNAIFCSELVAAAMHRLIRFNTKNSSVWNPSSLMSILQRRGIVHPPEIL